MTTKQDLKNTVQPFDTPDSNCTIFAIETTKYSGNFEREMCAYVTGHYGDCEVGSEIAETARPDIEKECPEVFQWLKEGMTFVTDEHGCRRPASGGNYHNQPNTVCIFMNKTPPIEVIEYLKKRAKQYAEQNEEEKEMKILSFVLVEYIVERKITQREI